MPRKITPSTLALKCTTLKISTLRTFVEPSHTRSEMQIVECENSNDSLPEELLPGYTTGLYFQQRAAHFRR